MKHFSTIYDLFLFGLKEYGAREFLQFENESAFTWEETHQRVLAYANALYQQGVRENDVVGVALERSTHTVISFLAINLLGAVYCPLDISLPNQVLSSIILESEVDIFITRSDTLFDMPSFDRCRKLYVENIVLREDDYRIKEHAQFNAAQPSYRVCSSGSTGKPKVMELSQAVYRYWAPVLQKKFKHFDSNSIILSHTPVGFDPSIWDYFNAILFGAKLIIASEATAKSSSKLIHLMKEQQVTDIIIVPEIARALQLKDHLSELVESGLRAIQFTGSCFDSDFLHNQLSHQKKLKFYNCWGPTEFGFGAIVQEVTSNDIYNNKVAIGNTENELEMQLFVEEKGEYRLAEEKEEGRIFLRAKHSITSYVNNQHATNNNFINLIEREKPFFDTGDTGVFICSNLRDEKQYYCLGREHLTEIKIHGVKIDLLDIENNIRQHPDVLEAAVVLPKECREQPRIAAYIQFKDACESDDPYQMGLKDFLLARSVQVNALPYYIIDIDEMPFSSSGKIDRRALTEKRIDQKNIKEDSLEYMNSIEECIVTHINNMTNVKIDEIDLEQTIVEMGCKSLFISSLRSKLTERYHIELAFDNLVQLSIRSLATHILEKIVLSACNRVTSSSYSKLLFLLQDGDESLPPICLLSGITGSALTEFSKFSNHIKTESKVYLLSDPNEDFNIKNRYQINALKISDLATMYLTAIKTLRLKTHVHLIGWSFGGNVAWEMASRTPVISLQILDTNAPVHNLLGLTLNSKRVLEEIMSMLYAMTTRFYFNGSEDLKKSSVVLLNILKDNICVEELSSLEIREQITQLFNYIYLYLPVESNQQLIQLLTIVQRNMMALYQYRPSLLSTNGSIKSSIKVYASAQTIAKNDFILKNVSKPIIYSAFTLGWCQYLRKNTDSSLIETSRYSSKETDHFSILENELVLNEVNQFLESSRKLGVQQWLLLALEHAEAKKMLGIFIALYILSLSNEYSIGSLLSALSLGSALTLMILREKIHNPDNRVFNQENKEIVARINSLETFCMQIMQQNAPRRELPVNANMLLMQTKKTTL